MGELRPGPVVVDDRLHLLLHEGVHAVQQRPVLGRRAAAPGRRSRRRRASVAPPRRVGREPGRGGSRGPGTGRPRGPARRPREQAKVAVGVDVQPGVGDQPGHHAGVDQRDDRVVGARQHQRRLPEQRQERQAGPAEARGELVERTRGRRPARQLRDELGGARPGGAAGRRRARPRPRGRSRGPGSRRAVAIRAAPAARRAPSAQPVAGGHQHQPTAPRAGSAPRAAGPGRRPRRRRARRTGR